jgi:hypothetical protein
LAAQNSIGAVGGAVGGVVAKGAGVVCTIYYLPLFTHVDDFNHFQWTSLAGMLGFICRALISDGGTDADDNCYMAGECPHSQQAFLGHNIMPLFVTSDANR